jgi:hypothetical protein
MSRGLELVAAREWIHETLDGDATITAEAPGGVWHHPVPRSVDPDQVVVTYQPVEATDVNGLGDSRILTDSEWLVRVIGPGDDIGALLDAYARVDALLDGARCTSVTTGRLFGCRRVRPFSEAMSEPDPGGSKATYRSTHLGGFYQIHVAGD